jgi:hypothetical protein
MQRPLGSERWPGRCTMRHLAKLAVDRPCRFYGSKYVAVRSCWCHTAVIYHRHACLGEFAVACTGV